MPVLTVFITTTSAHTSPVFPVLLLLAGVLMFIFGFRTYREYRIMEDTPQIPVRSVPMGLVHVSGKSSGCEPLTSPLTSVPCYYYEVKVEKRVKKDNREQWENQSTEKMEAPFYIQDATGQILVNPQNAEFDVPRTFMGELRPAALLSFGSPARSFDTSLGVPPPTDEHLRAYLSGGGQPGTSCAEVFVYAGSQSDG